MKTKKHVLLFALIGVFSAFLSSCDTMMVTSATAQVRYVNPGWAPPYYEGVRYYYIPDIEMYFDLAQHEFIYLEDGRWYSSRVLPRIYANFDLDNCFSIALSVNVFRPWLHHQYYISHYPRYYYRDYYDHRNIPYVRGFNENNRKPFFWDEKDRSRARKWDSEGLKDNRKFKYERYDQDVYQRGNREDQGRRSSDYQNNRQSRDSRSGSDGRQQQYTPQQQQQQPGQRGGNDNRQQPNYRPDNNNTQPQGGRSDNNIYQPQTQQKTAENSNNQQRNSNAVTQSPSYYGKSIGQPVKVQRQMREPKSSSEGRSSQYKSGENSNTNKDNQNSSGGRR